MDDDNDDEDEGVADDDEDDAVVGILNDVPDVEVDGPAPLAVAALERAERGERGGENRGMGVRLVIRCSRV